LQFIRGDSRVARINLDEFMRIYRHYSFRDWLSSQPKDNQTKAKMSHPDKKNLWWKNYFGVSFESRQREYFAGKNRLDVRLAAYFVFPGHPVRNRTCGATA
jgi:hypothetical protein